MRDDTLSCLFFQKKKTILSYANCGRSEEVYVYKQGEKMGMWC